MDCHSGYPYNYPPMPTMPPPQKQLDLAMLPSIIQVINDDKKAREGYFPTGWPNAQLPPLSSTQFYAQDQGNCNPKLMRSTLYTVPQNEDMLKQAGIPLGVVVSPFARLNNLEKEPPLIDNGVPIRCQRCKAYMCAFMEFQDGGRSFKCALCHASTPVDDTYFAHLDHTGRRTDIHQRPELCLGAYDIVATKEYCKNGEQPKEPAYIFLIDVSYASISNGLVPLLCHNLEKVLTNLPRETDQLESSIRVGLATFDQAVHFFDISSPKPKMLVIPDIHEPFVPCVEGLLLPYTEALPGLRAALAEIPKLFSSTKKTETILQPVIQAGLDALKCADRVGKLIVFTTTLPTFDAPGKLKMRNERHLLETEKEKNALMPQNEIYTRLGEECVKSGVSVDLFVLPNSFIDIATIGQLSAVTGGSIYKYQYFSSEKDGIRMLNDLAHHISKTVAFDCVSRVRTSIGIRPENANDLIFGSIDESKAFIVQFNHDGELTNQHVIIQCAILYTTLSGKRRLRVMTMNLPVSSDFHQLYQSVDMDTLTTLMLKQAVQMNIEKGNKETKEKLTNQIAQSLACYREKCGKSAPFGQLILPETLKLMPLFVNCILKNDAITGGSEIEVDEKAWIMGLIKGIRTEDAISLLYPQIYAIPDLIDGGDTTGRIRASFEYLETNKSYCIDNGVTSIVWIGSSVPQEWIMNVFRVADPSMIDTTMAPKALRRIEGMLPRGIRQRKWMVVVEKDSQEQWMRKMMMVEDRSTQSTMSYVDYLLHIHRQIRSINS